jgi:hypothetical protein
MSSVAGSDMAQCLTKLVRTLEMFALVGALHTARVPDKRQQRCCCRPKNHATDGAEPGLALDPTPGLERCLQGAAGVRCSAYNH